MSRYNSGYTVRDCAQALMAALVEHKKDQDKLRDSFHAAFQPLLKRDDLQLLGVPRKGNHIDNSQYLYYDGQMHLTLDQLPKGKIIPPHDHGTWEAMAIWRGRLKHTVFDRLDDRKTPGYADLKVVDDRVLTPGDLAMVIPPAEIHSFTAMDDETFAITIVGGHYKPQRHYYDPEKKSYVVRAPGQIRTAA